jgi:hypothetical protein
MSPPFSQLGSLTQPLPLANWAWSHTWPVRSGKSKGQRKRLRTIAVGVLELIGGMHAQACRAVWRAIGVARHFFVSMVVEWNGGNAEPSRHRLIDIPVVVGGISRHMDGELVGGNDGKLVEGTIVRDVGLIECIGPF